MSSRREAAVVLFVWAAGAALLALAAARPWGSVDGGGLAGATPVEGPAAARALGVATLAAAAATPLLGPSGRRLVGVVGVLLGAGGAGAALTGAPATSSPWRWVAVLGAVVVVLAALATVARAGRWGGGSRRSPRTAPPADPAAAPDGDGARGDPTPRETWDALDRGEDPTALSGRDDDHPRL